MTVRLYYDDAFLTRFSARATELFTLDGQPAVVLDRTAFYPTSGGQPFDTGTLDGVGVVDVVERETDGAVIHVLDAPLDHTRTEVVGEIDWERRFDHMQQHTGQHILSQAFVQIAQAETVGFHLGAASVTVDLSGPRPLDADVMAQAELLTNQILWQDRPVVACIVSPLDLSDVPLRKPPTVSGDVRIVQVEGFDWSACGGTHVARTGQVGLLKIIRWERRGAETRVEFRCGRRALRDYDAKNRIIQQVAAGFNVGYWELDAAVDRLKAEARDLRTQWRETARLLTRYKARDMLASAETMAGVRMVVCNLSQDTGVDLRRMARELVSEPAVVALLGATSSSPGPLKAQLCFARSPDLTMDMVPLLQDAVQGLGGRGGGQPDMAQGGGAVADKSQLDTVLEHAAQKLREQWRKAE